MIAVTRLAIGSSLPTPQPPVRGAGFCDRLVFGDGPHDHGDHDPLTWRQGKCQPDDVAMDRGLFLLLIGVPLPIIILLVIFWLT